MTNPAANVTHSGMKVAAQKYFLNIERNYYMLHPISKAKDGERRQKHQSTNSPIPIIN